MENGENGKVSTTGKDHHEGNCNLIIVSQPRKLSLSADKQRLTTIKIVARRPRARAAARDAMRQGIIFLTEKFLLKFCC